MVGKENRSLTLAMALEWKLYDYVINVLGMHKLEGVQKDRIFKNGELYDVIVTGILKEDWYKIKTKYTYEKIKFLTQ